MLKQRIITAVFLVLAVLLSLFNASTDSWGTLLLIVAGLSAWEWAGFAKAEKSERYAFVVVSVLCTWALMSAMNVWIFILLVIAQTYLYLSTVHRYQRTQGAVGLSSKSSIYLTGLLAIANFSAALFLMRDEFSPEWLLFAMATIWAIDTGAYFAGRKFGKTKLAVHVSPGKTWEGVIGGALLSFVLAVVGASVGLFPAAIEGVMATVLLVVALTVIALLSIYGDLFESVLKRQAGLKDSGKILPGHGGILDRIDSLVIAMPMLLVVLVLLSA